MRISLLDRSRTRAGQPDAEAVATTIARAVAADGLGIHRFWTAEHHAVPGIASASPAVLLAAIGARTSRIRIGTGGIMVPNHRPLAIADQALLLEAMHPGRVDLGLGGSLGFTAPIRRALGRTELGEGEYAAEVEEVREYLTGRGAVTARPRVDPPPMFLLAIRDGLSLAAEFGLPAVVGGSLLRDRAAIDRYRQEFRPSEQWPEPQIIASVEVSIAETANEARELLLPEAWAFADSRDVGEFRALQPVDEARRLLGSVTNPKKARSIEGWIRSAVAGTTDEVAGELARIAEATGAEEILATVSTYDPEVVLRTDAALARMQG